MKDAVDQEGENAIYYERMCEAGWYHALIDCQIQRAIFVHLLNPV